MKRQHFSRVFLNALSIAFVFAANSSPAVAECGKGAAPSYSDIEAIRYVRTNCFGKCPNYEVLFTKDLDCYYVGSEYVQKRGTFSSACAPSVLKSAIAALRAHNFYNLNYDPSIIVLDVPHDIVAVARCGVTTKLDWPSSTSLPNFSSLFEALDAVTDRIHWHKVNASLHSPLPLIASIP